MGDADQKSARTLILVTLGVLAMLAFIGLPWALYTIAQEKPSTTVLSKENCKEGTACKACVDKGVDHVCTDGICDAQGNCLSADTNTVKPNISGVKGLVYT